MRLDLHGFTSGLWAPVGSLRLFLMTWASQSVPVKRRETWTLRAEAQEVPFALKKCCFVLLLGSFRLPEIYGWVSTAFLGQLWWFCWIFGTIIVGSWVYPSFSTALWGLESFQAALAVVQRVGQPWRETLLKDPFCGCTTLWYIS